MQKTCGRLSPAVRLYAANFTVRVITMCQRDTSDHRSRPSQREDSSPRARTRRQATLSTAEDRKTFGWPGEALPWLLLVSIALWGSLTGLPSLASIAILEVTSPSGLSLPKVMLPFMALHTWFQKFFFSDINILRIHHRHHR